MRSPTASSPSSTCSRTMTPAPPGFEMRWPDGFVCPACGHEKGWALRRKAHTFECAGCRRHPLSCVASKLPRMDPTASYALSRNSSVSALTAALGCSPTSCGHHGRPRAQPVVGPGGNRQIRTKDDPPTGTQPRRQDAHIELGTETSQAACGWPKSPPTAPPTSDTSSKPPPIPTPSRKPTAGPATLPPRRSPRPCRGTAAHLVLPWDATKSSPTSKDSTTGCVASICRPISMSSFEARSSASPPMQNPLPTVDRTGAMA